MGQKVVGFSENTNSVTVKIAKSISSQSHDNDKETYENLNNDTESGIEGEEKSIEAVYLLGADGAHSTIRRLLSLPFDGTTSPTQLVATDIVFDFHVHGFYDANL